MGVGLGFAIATALYVRECDPGARVLCVEGWSWEHGTIREDTQFYFMKYDILVQTEKKDFFYMLKFRLQWNINLFFFFKTFLRLKIKNKRTKKFNFT